MSGADRSARLLWPGWGLLALAVLAAVAMGDGGGQVSSGGAAIVVPRWLAAVTVLALLGAASVAVWAVVQAVRARRQAGACARQLAESQAATAVILETAVEGIITIDERGIVQSFNRAAEKIFGYAADEVVGHNVKMLMPPPESDLHDGYLAHHLRTGESKGIGVARERRGKRKSGVVFPLEVAVSEVHLPDRRLFAGICHDITQRKRAEEALAASRSFLQTVIDGIPDAVMVIDRDYRIVLANRAVREAAGVEDPVASLLTCYQATHHCNTPCEGTHTCPLEQVLSTKRPVTVTHTHLGAAGGETTMEIIAAPILDETGEVVQIVEACRDVTARVRAEEEARQRQADLAHLSRLGTMGEMAASLAHELNQPLSAIVNYTQACLERIRAGNVDPQGLLEDLSDVGTQAQRAGDIIEHVRGFVRKSDPARSRTALNELVHEAMSLLHAEIQRRKVTLRLELHEELPPVEVVPIQIVQVIVNLIQNALDAMSDVDADRRHLVISTRTNGNGGVELAVRDTGVGMPPGEAEQVFAPFFTTKADGMGMGLAMCRSIIEAHGGTIGVICAQNPGTTVRFTLPARNGADATTHGDE